MHACNMDSPRGSQPSLAAYLHPRLDLELDTHTREEEKMADIEAELNAAGKELDKVRHAYRIYPRRCDY